MSIFWLRVALALYGVGLLYALVALTRTSDLLNRIALHAAYLGINIAILAFLLAPIAIVVVFALNPTPYISFPPVGISLRWFDKFFANEDFMRSLDRVVARGDGRLPQDEEAGEGHCRRATR